MELRANIPLDTRVISGLIKDPEDMQLVWPKARWPFDHEQWRRALDPNLGHHPFLIYENSRLIGHAALRATDATFVFTISYLYLDPQWRNQGRGQALVALLEAYAIDRLQALQLNLVVRDYNPRAQTCYRKRGFKAVGQEGTLIHMAKKLRRE